MYGKIFEQLYEGSMVGAGATVFAVWGYVIANMKADGKPGAHTNAQVDLNPKLLGFILGEAEAKVMEAIDFLTSPDGNSRSPDEQGRRLLKVGQFTYRVVNGAKYMDIRSAEERRAYFRDAKRKQRVKEAPKSRKVLAEECAQEALREKMNPNWKQHLADHQERLGDNGSLTAQQIVQRKVSDDTITKADKSALRKKGLAPETPETNPYPED